MQELNEYRLLSEHPIILFTIESIILIGLLLFIMAKVTAHKDKHGKSENDDGR